MKAYAKRIARLGLLGAVLIASQVALAFLPNIELVTLLIIIYAHLLGKDAFAPVAIFILGEGLIYGFGIWWFAYVYIWPLLLVIALLTRKMQGKAFATIMSGAFGLFFGALCSICYLFIGGLSSAFAFWASGILFDILHCFGNVIAALVLYNPIKKALLCIAKKEQA